MRLSREQRLEAELDLNHWGGVARRRWRCERGSVHPIARMMELGMAQGPTRYEQYEYEPDDWFRQTNAIVIRLPEADRAVLVAHYIDQKPWRTLCRMMGLPRWWHVGQAVRQAELMYLLVKETQPLAKYSDLSTIC